MNGTDSPVSIEKKYAAGIIRFLRPEQKNPLSVETLDALESVLRTLICESVERIIITGSGDTFASGANIREVAVLDPETARDFGQKGQELMLSIARSPIPVIAAIDGYCFGGALDLAVACAKRVASERSVFCHPGPKLGIITGWGGTQFLPRLIGEKRALDMLLTARTVGADEALEMGLIDQINPDPLQAALEI
ncbi:MAG: enoyl-CoA hydratase/isomerase family protein [Acidobacteria bacterium]|nr:MAG: enoyl-CoA hydratase/isomerase family protein [Acidobacteriota bacterium]REK01774.1 MAG: enoyl-CoA hydratase/isomerase family protein [Acidobacteriota bacterium]REK14730.1 MAG: enoyl-CoA hydratase/isomerase family protein [Acidobacteriota bacterium]REK45445.1 MAG: enoyl-CoA hydratase/isomerase family protein [Acidobacteriota bacterium]